MLKIAEIVFLGVVTAAAMVTGSNSVSAQTSTGNPQYKEAELLDWIMDGADTRKYIGDGSKQAGYAASFTFVLNKSCIFLPTEVAAAVKLGYDNVRRGNVTNLSHRIAVEGALAGIEDAKLFVAHYGCEAPESKNVRAHLLKTWEAALAEAYAKNLPDEPKV